MNEILPALCAAGGLLLGAVFVFLLLKAKLAETQSALERKLTEAETSLSHLREQLDQKENHLQEREDKLAAGSDALAQTEQNLALSQAENQNLESKLKEQEKALEENERRLRESFQNLANEILEAKTKKFTETNKENLKGVLQPFGKDLKEFRHKVESYNENNVKARAALRERLDLMQEAQASLSEDAQNLTDALKGQNKKQGDWGEVILERTLEVAGLEEGQQYSLQETFGHQRPDAVIQLPADRQIIVDAKVSLTAYERYCSTEDETESAQALKEHANSLKTHVDGLSKKNYQEIEGITSLDFVLLFVPIEPAFGAALRQEPDLYDYAFRKRIIIVTSTTLLATLRTVENVWRIEKQNLNAEEIARQAAALYDKFEGFLSNLETVGKSLDKASEAHRDAVKQLKTGRGSLVTRVENFKKLGVKPKKALPATFQEEAKEEKDDGKEALALKDLAPETSGTPSEAYEPDES